MWKPNYVIEEDKKKANVVWNMLLATLVGLFVWKVVDTAIKYHNPDTSFTVSDDVYRFPFMEVCFFEGSGCDADLAACIDTVDATVFDACQKIVDVQLSDQESVYGCVSFDLEEEDFEASECLTEDQRPYVELHMFWEPAPDGGNEEYISRVAVYLGGAQVQQQTWVPYSRLVVSEENRFSEVKTSLTDMTIGKSIKDPLLGSSSTNYPTLTLSTTEFVSPNQADFLSSSTSITTTSSSTTLTNESTLGSLHLTLTLGSFSLTTLKEDNPVDIPDFIASIGGFWEVLLLGWGLFFIATRDTTPVQKARSFEEPIERSKSIMRMGGSSRISSRKSATASDAEVGGEEQPDWDIAHGGPLRATGSTNVGTAVSANPTEATGGTNGGTVSANEATV